MYVTLMNIDVALYIFPDDIRTRKESCCPKTIINTSVSHQVMIYRLP